MVESFSAQVTPSQGEPVDPSTIASQIELALDELEGRLLSLVRDAAHGARSLDGAISGLAEFANELRPQYRSAQEILGRRDLSYETSAKLEGLGKRCLWLYRKCRLERLFFQKLQIERTLRDVLYREVLEAWHEISFLEDEERSVRTLSEDALVRSLMGETDLPPPS